MLIIIIKGPQRLQLSGQGWQPWSGHRGKPGFGTGLLELHPGTSFWLVPVQTSGLTRPLARWPGSPASQVMGASSRVRSEGLLGTDPGTPRTCRGPAQVHGPPRFQPLKTRLGRWCCPKMFLPSKYWPTLGLFYGEIRAESCPKSQCCMPQVSKYRSLKTRILH